MYMCLSVSISLAFQSKDKGNKQIDVTDTVIYKKMS